jgi:hypothetical protein
MDRKKYSGIGQLRFFFCGQLNLIWALHRVEWTSQFGNIDLAMWNWWLGNADMATGLDN